MDPIENYKPPEEIEETEQKKETKKNFFTASVVVTLLILIIIITTLFAYSYFTNFNRTSPAEIKTTPTKDIKPSPSPTLKPSLWATESAIIKLEENTRNNENELKTMDLNETSLSFPSLDFNINFEKK